ncbi:MAG: lamin tail domain-containing protein [Candidatus Colwellbacteria bacterium]|nr:lamin tail domain-containing protein [Candidatus Colwellbacteria bacterium]
MPYFKEVLPNPVGRDTEAEWVKLINDSDSLVNLLGWRFNDASGKTFNLSGTISPQEELILPYSLTRISLNNDGDKLVLINPQGKVADELSYGQVGEDEIIVAPRYVQNVGDVGVVGNAGDATSIENEDLVGQINKTDWNFNPVFIALVPAALLSLGIGYLLKNNILGEWKK